MYLYVLATRDSLCMTLYSIALNGIEIRFWLFQGNPSLQSKLLGDVTDTHIFCISSTKRQQTHSNEMMCSSTFTPFKRNRC